MFEEGWNNIQDEMVDPVNAHILTDRKLTIEDISELLGISMNTFLRSVVIWFMRTLQHSILLQEQEKSINQFF